MKHNPHTFHLATLERAKNKVAVAWRCKVINMSRVAFHAYATRDGCTAEALLIFTPLPVGHWDRADDVLVDEAAWKDGHRYAKRLRVPLIIVIYDADMVLFKREADRRFCLGRDGQGVRVCRQGFQPLRQTGKSPKPSS